MSLTQEKTEQQLATSSSASSTASIQHETPSEPKPAESNDADLYPSTAKAALILASIFVNVLLIALDRLLIGVAIPRITDDFDSLGDVGWYGSAYLLTSCAFCLLFGKVYMLWNPKWIYLSSLVVFEVGSAVCGAAPNSTALIVGRAIAGLGAAGLQQGGIIIIIHILPLHKRPQVMGFIGMMFGIASAIGPLIGGALTDGPGWRWCFYINLPCGGAAFVLVLLALKLPDALIKRAPLTPKEKFARLDPIGTSFFLPAIICLLLALQWGGITYAWSDGRIIALLVLFGVLMIVFGVVQWWKGENATIPGSVIRVRSVLAGFFFIFCLSSGMQPMIYYLSIWFQAVQGVSAVESGIRTLPFLLGMICTMIPTGIATKKLGYYTPWMIICAVLSPIGAGLVSTFSPDIGSSMWIGYQALFGLGIGFGMMQSQVAAQTVLPREKVSIGTALMTFGQTLGGTIFISVGNNLFDSRLSENLQSIPGINLASVVSTGATELRSNVPADILPHVILAYNDALRTTFYMVTGMVSFLVIGALAMEWRSVKPAQKKNDTEQGSVSEAQKPERIM